VASCILVRVNQLTVRVAVRSSDPLSEAGVASILRGDPRVRLLDGTAAEVIVVVEDVVGDGVLSWLREATCDLRYVLVTDQFRPSNLLAAVDRGVMAVLPRRRLHPGQLVAAVISVGNGGAHFSSALQGELLGRLDTMRREVLEPNGFTMSGLSARERSLLRGLAEGLRTDEIATEIGCTERTVKTLLYQLMARHKLNTRSHAVAYALRAGIVPLGEGLARGA
jgi:DNA-binding NarL/FixJ family response regulator